MEEIWKPIEGFEGRYEVSSLGRVKSLPRPYWNHNGYAMLKERILKPAENTYRKTPYLYVGISDSSGKRHSLSVHTLVCKAFHGPKPEQIDGDKNVECMHLNGNSLDNRAENLAWGTHSQNMREKTCIQSHIMSCRLSIPVIQCDLDGNEIARFPSARNAASRLGLWAAAISECVRGGRYRTHGGYRWKRAD